MADAPEYTEAPIDTLGYRIDHARGIATLILVNYDDQQECFTAGPKYLRGAVSALVELLDQADAAWDAHVDAQFAKKLVR